MVQGPGISQRAAAARSQTVWRWLVEPQASSLTAGPGFDRINLERNNMDTTQLKRIADALEEILRLVKKDMEPRTKKEKADEGNFADGR